MPRQSFDKIRSDMARLVEEQVPDVGDRLPSERDLARHLGCSREMLRKVLAELEREGKIWRHVGQGTFRGVRPRHLPVRETVLIEGASSSDVMLARMLLEPEVAAEAARRATASDVIYLRAKIAQGRAAIDRSTCEQADDAFHRAISQVSQNPVVIGFLTYLSGARRRVAWQREWDRTYRRIGVSEFRTVHSDQHDRIVDAIEIGNAQSASAAMKAHLAAIEAAMSSKPE